MKAAITIVRILVGVLFIISGLVKANDPHGLSYKMQEFFEIWTIGLQSSEFFLKSALIALFRFFHDYSLALSVIMITLEIIAGVALLLGWMKRFVLNLLLLLIVFFTFLTAYALFSKNPDGSPKFTNCGCFGDCLPIPPVASFTKDLVLLALIIFLIAGRKYIVPLFSRGAQAAVMLFSLIASLGLQWYALNYLPPVDCLPFKVKNNIPEKMKIPAGAVPDSVALRFIYEKGGKKYEFSTENFPPDLGSYKFVDRTDKLIRKGNAEAPIKGFTLNAGNMDSTEIVLSQPATLLLFCLSLDGASSWMKYVKEVHAIAKARQIPLYVVTAAPLQQISAALISNGMSDVQAFNTDNTVVRTATRTNPTLYYLEKGTIINKYSRMNIKDAAADLKNR